MHLLLSIIKKPTLRLIISGLWKIAHSKRRRLTWHWLILVKMRTYKTALFVAHLCVPELSPLQPTSNLLCESYKVEYTQKSLWISLTCFASLRQWEHRFSSMYLMLYLAPFTLMSHCSYLEKQVLVFYQSLKMFYRKYGVFQAKRVRQSLLQDGSNGNKTSKLNLALLCWILWAAGAMNPTIARRLKRQKREFTDHRLRSPFILQSLSTRKPFLGIRIG